MRKVTKNMHLVLYLFLCLLSQTLQPAHSGQAITTTELDLSFLQSSPSAASKVKARSLAVRGKLAFISEVGGGRSIYLIDPNYLDVHPLGRLHVDEGEIDQFSLTISPDRKRVVFSTQFQYKHALWVADIDGSAALRVTDYLQGLAYSPRSLAWSPDGQHIAIALRSTEVFAIHVLNADGSNFRRVANGDQLAWSPDSRRLAITAFTQGSPGRYIDIVDIDGSNLRRLTSAGETSLCEWSPDGERIAFVEHRKEVSARTTFDIFFINSDGSRKRKVAENLPIYGKPSWSPDGEFFSFITQILDKGGLYLISESREGTIQTRFLEDVKAGFSWSPDAKRVAYGEDGVSVVDVKAGKGNYLIHTKGYLQLDWLSDGEHLLLTKTNWLARLNKTDPPDFDLYVTSIETKQLQRLTDERLSVQAFSCSPNGQQIAFLAPPRVNYGVNKSVVYVVNTDGSNLRSIRALGVSPGWFAWSPDGRHFAYVRGIIDCSAQCRARDLEIDVESADGSYRRTIVNQPAWNFAPVWQPDGKHLLFLSDRNRSNAVYLTDLEGKKTRLLLDINKWLPSVERSSGWPTNSAFLWSPTLMKLAVMNRRQLDIVNINERTTVQIPLKNSGYNMTWSPDEKQLAFVDYAHDQPTDMGPWPIVYVANVDGSGKRISMPGGQYGTAQCTDHPAWSPDGKRLACSGIMLFNPDGSNPQWVISGTSPAWLP